MAEPGTRNSKPGTWIHWPAKHTEGAEERETGKKDGVSAIGYWLLAIGYQFGPVGRSNENEQVGNR